MNRSIHRLFTLASLTSIALGYSACSPQASGPDAAGAGGAGAVAGAGGGSIIVGNSGGSGVVIDDIPPPMANGEAFPAAPINEENLDISAFEADPNTVGTGACIFEPHLSDGNGPGALFPQNWLRPRFRWEGTGTETAWEIKLTAPGQTNALRAYTTDTSWIMPRELWTTIGAGVQDVDITVTIRGTGGAGFTGMQGTFRITGALAGGSMVFWGTESSEVLPGTSRLYGFSMGDEVVLDTLATEQVTSIENVFSATGADRRGELAGDNDDGDYIAGFDFGGPRCIGCHSSTPDGAGMIFTDDYPWNIGIASVAEGQTGATPTFVSTQAREFLKMPFLGTGMMLPAAFAGGDRTLITTRGRREDSSADYVYINYGYGDPMTFEPDVHDMIWIDLETTATVSTTVPAATEGGGSPPYSGFYTGEDRKTAAIARGEQILAAEGDAWGVLISESMSISNPSPAKLSNRLAYTVSESSMDGHPDWHNNTADIKIADLAAVRSTATGTPLLGASDPGFLEYYPAFSPDDAFVAFNRAAAPTNTTRCSQSKQVNRTADPEGSPAICDNYSKELGANPDGPYYNRNGEIHVVASAGGTPHRLRGNDPVMCGGQVSPGVLNSWPKWSSAVRDINGKLYYFVIFSSAREYPDQFELTPTDFTPPIETKSSQLYMSTIEYDPATGVMTSYGAIYLWNQNYLSTGNGQYEALRTANLTPAWEDFTIPDVPDIIVIK